MRTRARALAVLSAVLVVVAGCADGNRDADTGASSTGAVRVYGSAGVLAQSVADQFSEAGALAGLRGAVPLVDFSDDFTNRLDGVRRDNEQPNLEGVYRYAGEAYDAVTLVGIAAYSANSTDPAVFAPYIDALTYGGEKCTDFGSCREILDDGGDVDYDGVSGPLDFTPAGEPSVASFGLLTLGADNRSDPSTARFQVAGPLPSAPADTAAGPPVIPAGTLPAPFDIGTLVPQTGALSGYGQAVETGARFAVDELNGEGILGDDDEVQLITADSGDGDPDTASAGADELLGDGVAAIVGSLSAPVTLSVIDTIVDAGVVMFGPADTADVFTTYDDRGLYFRTAPPDQLQAVPLADLVLGDGNRRVGILAIGNDFGDALAANVTSQLVAGGLAEDDVLTIPYDPAASSYQVQVQQLSDFDPDGVLVIGFDESARVLQEIDAQGIGPAGP